MRFSVTLFAASLSAAAHAAVQVVSPSASLWWVANSKNVITWTCQDPSAPKTYTVLAANTNTQVLTSPIAILSVVNNYDCSETVPVQNLAAATGYTILLANPLNATQVYATSAPFEIKAEGSAYPVTTVVSSATQTATQSSSGSATSSVTSTTSKPNSASNVASLSAVVGVGAAALAALGAIVV